MFNDLRILADRTSSCKVILYPNESNPITSTVDEYLYDSGFFWGKNSDPSLGPDYYLGDVLKYNEGFLIVENTKKY